EAFTLMLDEANYPIVFHCIGGTDRTGTMATLLNALLGVNENELCRDYEASWFRNAGGIVDERHRRWFEGLLTHINRLEGENLREKVESFVIGSCGFTMDDISKFREIMLEK
ncbi:MAG: tyrosine-protein phosphatase, partial [Victivallales bacterium]|nr:tyrosine-protein phosphatase [Victivallales bacterium]